MCSGALTSAASPASLYGTGATRRRMAGPPPYHACNAGHTNRDVPRGGGTGTQAQSNAGERHQRSHPRAAYTASSPAWDTPHTHDALPLSECKPRLPDPHGCQEQQHSALPPYPASKTPSNTPGMPRQRTPLLYNCAFTCVFFTIVSTSQTHHARSPPQEGGTHTRVRCPPARRDRWVLGPGRTRDSNSSNKRMGRDTYEGVSLIESPTKQP